jgi:hypothetical protein
MVAMPLRILLSIIEALVAGHLSLDRTGHARL